MAKIYPITQYYYTYLFFGSLNAWILWLLIITICRQLISPNNQMSRNLTFDVIEIQGGGRIEIQSDKDGLSIKCTALWIRSGGVLIADRLSIVADSVTIEQSGIIDLNYKVNFCYESVIRYGFLDMEFHKFLCWISIWEWFGMEMDMTFWFYNFFNLLGCLGDPTCTLTFTIKSLSETPYLFFKDTSLEKYYGWNTPYFSSWKVILFPNINIIASWLCF